MAGRLPTRRERLRQEMTAEIVAAARLLLEKNGPQAISVRAIARQVGVTPAALYRYFPGLDALIGALSDSVLSELCEAVESARDQSADRGPADRIAGMARAFRGWALDHPADFGFVLGPGAFRAARWQPTARLLGLFLPELAGSPGDGLAPGVFLPLWATLYGLVVLEVSGDPEDLPADIGQLYAAALAGFGERLPGP